MPWESVMTRNSERSNFVLDGLHDNNYNKYTIIVIFKTLPCEYYDVAARSTRS